jgi:integrase/recombinase XerD
MNALNRHLGEYLELRHRLGFKLRDAGCELRKFVRFAQAAKAPFVTTQLALDWATQPTGCHPSRWTTRLGMVRRFSEYLSAVDPRTEVPPRGLLPHRYHRKSPYFYNDREVAQLIEAAQKIPSPKGFVGGNWNASGGGDWLRSAGCGLGPRLAEDSPEQI